MTKKTILVIGSSNTDMTAKTHSLPRQKMGAQSSIPLRKEINI